MEGEIITMQDLFVFEREGLDEDGNVLGRFRPRACVLPSPTASGLRGGPGRNALRGSRRVSAGGGGKPMERLLSSRFFAPSWPSLRWRLAVVAIAFLWEGAGRSTSPLGVERELRRSREGRAPAGRTDHGPSQGGPGLPSRVAPAPLRPDAPPGRRPAHARTGPLGLVGGDLPHPHRRVRPGLRDDPHLCSDPEPPSSRSRVRD
jgi:hypothetical protein